MEAAASGDKLWNCTESWQHLSCLPGPSSVDDPFEMAVERPRPQPLGMSPMPRRPGSEGQESRPAEAAKVGKGKGPASGLPAPKKPRGRADVGGVTLESQEITGWDISEPLLRVGLIPDAHLCQ